MKRLLLILACLSALAFSQNNQNNFGGSGSSSSSAAIITNGLIAEYRMTDAGTTTLQDFSGSGNNGTFPGGANNPTRISGTGGLQFTQATNQWITLPAALNSAGTIILVTNHSIGATQGASVWFSPLIGNSSASTCVGLFYSSFQTPSNAIEVLANWKNGTETQISNYAPFGTHVIGWVRDATADSFHFDNLLWNTSPVPGGPLLTSLTNPAVTTAAVANNGQYLLGGSNTVSCASGGRATNAFTGIIYYAAFYNRELSDQEYAQDYNAIVQMLSNRGVTVPQAYAGNCCIQNGNASNYVLMLGDSENASILPSLLTLNNGVVAYNLGIAGTRPEWDLLAMPAIGLPLATPIGGGTNAILWWSGTNDQDKTAAGTFSTVASVSKKLRGQGAKMIFMSMMSRTGADTFKNSYNALLRQNWNQTFDELVDVGGDVNLGCDGCSANNTFFSGGLHMTTHTLDNIVTPMVNRAINRLFGAQDFSQANVYSSAAAAAVATTAGSESTNTVTITTAATPANCNVGNMVTVAGVTPAGYNGAYLILTRSATQITYFDPTASMGAISVQGTIVCPVQQDGDKYSVLNFGAGNYTLETCDGYTGQNIYIKNINAAGSTIVPFGTETIDGASTLTIASKATVILQSILTSPSAAGCSWKQLQNN